MPSILDRQLDNVDQDAFGHIQFAEALRHLIESESNKPPYSIGLLGAWGTGKSTIKDLYLRSLKADADGKPGQRRSDRIRDISFNAWRFGGEEDLKRALLRDSFVQLGGDEEALRRELFEQVSSVTGKRRTWRDIFGEAIIQITASAVVFASLLTLVLLIAVGFIKLVGIEDNLSTGAIGVIAFFITPFLVKYLVDIRIRTPALFHPQTSISFPSTSAEEYERLLLAQIKEFRRKNGRNCERLVVFVDDLDRLSASEMVAGLDAIRTFLELPVSEVGENFGVVFVISCDEDRIAEALHHGRGRMRSADLPATVFSRYDARRYLDRLFQFRLEIPQFPKQDMRRFARERLEAEDGVSASFEKHEVNVDAVIERLVHVDVQSPRNAIQLLNAFVQTWWIASERERKGVGSDAPGVLSDGSVTDNPLALAALSVLRVDYPDFYDCVQKRPEFIHEFTRVIMGTEELGSQSIPAQEMSKQFVNLSDDETQRIEIKNEYRSLRRYLASLQDMRWPKRLQPLLLLAEDPITRKYGDGAMAVFDNLVSGDTDGVLEAFGRHLDTKSISLDDLSVLEDLTEGLFQETETRQINAARVLAALVDRLPDEEDRKRRLLTPLTRQLIAHKRVRENVGPESAESIIGKRVFRGQNRCRCAIHRRSVARWQN